MSAANFLVWELRQTLKHEFLRGEVFALTGASQARVALALNLAMALRQHLRGSPCRTLVSDMMLGVEAADACLYPEVMVTCSAADAADRLVTREPVLVVEVLPAAGAARQAGDKFGLCRTLPTLREYLHIDTGTRRCELQRKGDDGAWVRHAFEPGQAVRLASVGLVLSAAALWDKVPA
ncbi:MAG: Uma2 family endonuclease [Rubrivivax sp.]|nr:Uma2 family endonuclease [Rubrivivax sp.]